MQDLEERLFVPVEMDSEIDPIVIETNSIAYSMKLAKEIIYDLSHGVKVGQDRIRTIFNICEGMTDDLIRSNQGTQVGSMDIAYMYGYLGRLSHSLWNETSDIEWAKRWYQYIELSILTMADRDEKFTLFRNKDKGWGAKSLYFQDGQRKEMLEEWFDSHRHVARGLDVMVRRDDPKNKGLLVLCSVMYQSSALAAYIHHDKHGDKPRWKKKCEECCMKAKEVTKHIDPDKRKEILDSLRKYMCLVGVHDTNKLFY